MGQIRSHLPVKLIVGLIFKEETVAAKAAGLLARRFGKIDFQSQTLSFTHTDYYEREFGKGLKRRFISFKKLIMPEKIPLIKNIANKIEDGLSHNNLRRINIDPGYIELSKLVLVSTKDYRHRIYLKKGIYAEVTLSYQNKAFCPWDWTYPDYRTKEYAEIFNHIRGIYASQIKNK